LAHGLEKANGESLLLMACRRLDHLAEQLRHLALGLPDPDSEPVAAVKDSPNSGVSAWSPRCCWVLRSRPRFRDGCSRSSSAASASR
jgi:hypothetical protein